MHVPSLNPGFMYLHSQFRQIKIYSNCDKYVEGNIASLHDEMDYENITGFVSCDSGCKWWVEHVSGTSEEAGRVRVMYLHPNGAVPSYAYPTRLGIL